MNTKISAYTKAITLITCLVTLLATALRVVLMTDYNVVTGFYANETLHNIFKYPLFAFAAITFVLAYIYIKEGNCAFSAPENKIVTGVGYFCAAVFGGFILYTFACFVLPVLQNPNYAELAMAFFSLVALFYFISNTKRIGDARAVLACGSALVLLALVFVLYFSIFLGTGISYVNHTAVLCYATAIFLMLSAMGEANAILNRPFLRRYLAYAPVAVVLAFALSVPNVIFTVTEKKAPLGNFYFDIIILALGVYHLVRLVTLALIKPEKD